ncbi:MAG: methylenetetrahydrofolate dehydrogenase (NADP+) / methenyltetrahydrofolate cyclohydrolase [Parcubacteria group bacterium Gr01-1014_31]|nr:MAG: methylenetetrahydrofolate dehydrogenase (NADP+) / methenyltetrahydrofolate cyclohydrolase [Parcubacteria group bacterium Gr01-1014_31]
MTKDDMTTAQRLDGKALAEKILADVAVRVRKLTHAPGLAVILIGNDPASILYVRNKERACHKVGIAFHKYLSNDQFLPNADETQLLEAIGFLNLDPEVSGIIVQLPPPKGFHADVLVAAVDPAKDVDGFHPRNIEAFLAGRATLTPPLIAAVLRLLRESDAPLAGAVIAIVAKDGVLRKTLGKVLVDNGAHVTATTNDAKDFIPTLRSADIVITAVGKPGVITGALLKPGAVVVDIGITRQPDGTFAGDVDAASVEKVAAAFTPTPGGVGPLTVAMLLENVTRLEELSAQQLR